MMPDKPLLIRQLTLGGTPFSRAKKLKQLIDAGEVNWGGNSRLMIYGTLGCRSGKRLKPQNRVFFKDEHSAILLGYRPCGNCLKEAYKQWRQRTAPLGTDFT